MKARLIILVLMLLLPACTSSGLKITCNDQVRLELIQPEYSDGDFCYDERGNFGFAVYNYGSVDIEEFNFGIVMEDKVVNGTVESFIAPGNMMSIDVNFPVSTIGEPDKIILVPLINFENKTMQCWGNRIIKSNLKRCY